MQLKNYPDDYDPRTDSGDDELDEETLLDECKEFDDSDDFRENLPIKETNLDQNDSN